MRFEWGHLHIFLVGKDPVDQFAVVGLSGHDGVALPLSFKGVQAKFRLALGGVLTVALKTILREDRSDIAGVVDRLDRLALSRHQRETGQSDKARTKAFNAEGLGSESCAVHHQTKTIKAEVNVPRRRSV